MEWLATKDFSDPATTPASEDLGPFKRQLAELQLALMEVWEDS
jgi:hypothetical protein